LPATGCVLAIPFYAACIMATNFSSFVVLDCIAETILSTGLAVCFVAVLAVSGRRRSTTAMAIVQLGFMLIGGGIGPALAGSVSDALSATYGAESLRYAEAAMIVFLLPTALAFVAAGRTLRQELEA